ncbi:hypothetical protein [Ligilactobacillus animalis]|uniref:hypothetical protein n=1 Tax=Ligilactobacillus animalis TaxID=1605 RepID=UPI0027CD2304|nr:hypothetical protein [Ligilactobacillus animalis]MDQ2234121.1 hypothetical protein [Ligilactobacillus animalis]
MEKTLNLLMGRQVSSPQLQALGVALDSTEFKQRPAVIIKKDAYFVNAVVFRRQEQIMRYQIRVIIVLLA